MLRYYEVSLNIWFFVVSRECFEGVLTHVNEVNQSDSVFCVPNVRVRVRPRNLSASRLCVSGRRRIGIMHPGKMSALVQGNVEHFMSQTLIIQRISS